MNKTEKFIAIVLSIAMFIILFYFSFMITGITIFNEILIAVLLVVSIVLMPLMIYLNLSVKHILNHSIMIIYNMSVCFIIPFMATLRVYVHYQDMTITYLFLLHILFTLISIGLLILLPIKLGQLNSSFKHLVVLSVLFSGVFSYVYIDPHNDETLSISIENRVHVTNEHEIDDVYTNFGRFDTKCFYAAKSDSNKYSLMYFDTESNKEIRLDDYSYSNSFYTFMFQDVIYSYSTSEIGYYNNGVYQNISYFDANTYLPLIYVANDILYLETELAVYEVDELTMTVSDQQAFYPLINDDLYYYAEGLKLVERRNDEYRYVYEDIPYLETDNQEIRIDNIGSDQDDLIIIGEALYLNNDTIYLVKTDLYKSAFYDDTGLIGYSNYRFESNQREDYNSNYSMYYYGATYRIGTLSQDGTIIYSNIATFTKASQLFTFCGLLVGLVFFKVLIYDEREFQ